MIPRLGKTGMDVVESLSGKIGEAVPQLKGLTDSVGKLADKLKNMSTDELMNLGKTAAVLAGAGPAISLFGSQIGNVQSAVEGFSGITTGVLSELGKLPKGFKSATKSAANFQKDFTGSLKGLGSAVTGPFQVLTPKLSATVGKSWQGRFQCSGKNWWGSRQKSVLQSHQKSPELQARFHYLEILPVIWEHGADRLVLLCREFLEQ